jgi:hypothetical protein
MQSWSEAEIMAALSKRELFECQTECGSFTIKIQEYVPYICTAIHAGHRLSADLEEICNLSAPERRTEEDPYTDSIIESFPISLVAHDSRYEYDLNRRPEECIYSFAWKKQVWNKAHSDEQRARVLEKHSLYYRILAALIKELEQSYGGSLIFDLHSYNWKIRQYHFAPVFNIGTSQLNLRKWRNVIPCLEKQLQAIEIPNVDNTVARNAVFKGQGYQATFIKNNFPGSLIIPLEVKKIFMDEESGEVFPLVLEALQAGIHLAVLETATAFNRKLKRSALKPQDLLPNDLEPIVVKIDKALYKLSKNIETLQYVNPINLQKEKKFFFSRKNYIPDFKYRQLKIDPYAFNEKLYKLPVSEIQDPQLRELYRSTVEACATKVNLLAHIGTPQFFYNSLRYYGKPDKRDIANAQFLLHAARIEKEDHASRKMNAQEAKPLFEQAVDEFGFNCKVILSTRLIANAMVDNSRKILLINKKAHFTKAQVNALIHHELGVHMLTTFNA